MLSGLLVALLFYLRLCSAWLCDRWKAITLYVTPSDVWKALTTENKPMQPDIGNCLFLRGLTTPVVLDAVSLGAELPKHRCWVECSETLVATSSWRVAQRVRPCVQLKPLVTRECRLPPERRKYSKADSSAVKMPLAGSFLIDLHSSLDAPT